MGEVHREIIVRLTYADGSRKYEGQYNESNGKREGQGIETWTSGNLYEGQFFNDKRNGQGKMTGSDG